MKTHNFSWFQMGDTAVQLGWVLDPLTAIMLVMVSFVSLLIFIYSVGYMAHDENFTRFFCFLSLFAAAMLGLVIANSLLLLFICWELVGLASYLLIGFWYHKPSAAAAAKKAFITTRIGDVVFFLGILWLYSHAGTLLFYDGGRRMPWKLQNFPRWSQQTTLWGMAVTTGIGLLIFCGAIGKSGQVPLHVWLPDAMEGPTPVSALIHAATMVAAGVFLIARVFPLLDTTAGVGGGSAALTVVTWVGAITAVFAACIAVAQNGHQTHSRVFDGVATRFHDDGAGRGRRGGGNVPFDHARVLQGAVVPRRGFGDSRLPRGAGYPQDGRVEKIDAGDIRDLRDRHDGVVRRAAVLFRILEQGRNPACGAWMANFACAVLPGPFRCAVDGVLHDAAGVLRLFRPVSCSNAATTARCTETIRILRTKVRRS